MNFFLTIKCDNAAFCDADNKEFDDDAAKREISRILHEVAEYIKDGGDGRLIFDINGNRVGVCGIND